MDPSFKIKVDSFVKKLDDMHGVVSNVFLCIAGISLLLIVLLVCANIASRQLSESIEGTPEIVGWLTSIVISFSLVASQRRKAHVSMSAVLGSLHDKVRLVIQSLIYVVSFVFFFFVALEISRFGLNVMERNSLSSTLQVPYYGFVISVSIGFFLFSLTFILDLCISLSKAVVK